jgi:hypothetical protein
VLLACSAMARDVGAGAAATSVKVGGVFLRLRDRPRRGCLDSSPSKVRILIVGPSGRALSWARRQALILVIA